MTNKEILLSAIRLEKTPRIPVILLSSGVWVYRRYGLSLQDAFTMPPEKEAALLMNNAEELNVDIIWTAADCNNVVLKALGAKTTFDIIGGASTVDEPLIDLVENIEKLDLNDIEKSFDIKNLLEATKILKEKASGKYLIGVSQWGPVTLAGQMIGIEKFMKLIVKDKPATKTLLDFAEKIILKYIDLFRTYGAELVCISDPSASGDMISKKLFETVALPHLTSVFGKITAEAKMLHICGNTSKILEYIPLTGADMFSFDHKVEVSRAANVLGGKIAFAGQIDPVSVMLESTPEEVFLSAKACIGSAGNFNGYILMPGCDLPPKTRVENVLSMVKAAHNK